MDADGTKGRMEMGRKRRTFTDKFILLMRLIDEQYLRHSEFGYPRMTDRLRDEGMK